MPKRVRVVTEAIMVVDLVESTATSTLFGWHSVGRQLMRTLQQRIQQRIQRVAHYGLSCFKSTGDGYLLAFADRSAERGAIHAVEAAFAIQDTIDRYNKRAANHRQINLRFAVHFGEVDAVDDDRHGPNVAQAFRLEAIDPSSWSTQNAINTIPPEDFPRHSYVIASEQVKNILEEETHDPRWSCLRCGIFALKGFSGWHNVFLINRV